MPWWPERAVDIVLLDDARWNRLLDQRATDPTGLDRVAHGAVGGGVAQMVVGAHDHGGIAAGHDHRASVGQAQRQRLLAQDVLAGGGGGQGLILVQLVGGADVDDLDRRVGQQGLDAVMAVGDAVLGGVGLAPRRVAAHDRHGFAALGADGADNVLLGDVAGADQAPAELCGHVRRLSVGVSRWRHTRRGRSAGRRR